MSLNNIEITERLAAEMAEFQKDIEAVAGKTEEFVKEVLIEDSKTEEGISVRSDERQFNELELEQMDKGWDPNHPDGVSAKEFKRVGEIIEAKRKASREAQVKSKEVEELTKRVNKLIDHNEKLALSQQQAESQVLANLKLEKIREGEVDAVLAIEQRQRALEELHKAPAQQSTSQTISTEASEFREKYKTYFDGTNAESIQFKALVKAQLDMYQQTNPTMPDKDALAGVEELLGKAMPDQFAPKSKLATSKVGVSTTSSSSERATVSMTPADQALFNNIKMVDPKFTIKDFNEIYLKKRK